MTLGTMRFAIATLFAGFLASTVQAQQIGTVETQEATSTAEAQQNGWQSFIAVSAAYQGKGDLDSGGDFSISGVGLRGGTSGPVGSGTRAGVTLTYIYSDYSFSDPVAFGGVAPWSTVQRFGVAVPLSFALGNGWGLGVIPSVDWFKENGAKTDDSLAWGAIVSASKRFDDGNMVGLGVGVYDRIEQTAVFPFLLIDWRLSEHWRVINPLAAGPTGPAGVELDYHFDGGWTAGVGAAWRIQRFRLSENGSTPDGIGEERGAPVFLRVTREFGQQMALHLYAGVVAAGELRLENSSGNTLVKEDFDPAPFIALSFMARF